MPLTLSVKLLIPYLISSPNICRLAFDFGTTLINEGHGTPILVCLIVFKTFL